MIKTVYKCKSCDSIFNKWSGKCTNCNAWSSLEEIIEDNPKLNKIKSKVSAISNIKSLNDIEISDNTKNRFQTCFKELNIVLGGGILEDQIVLLGGEPGIGKSTLIMQVCLDLASKKKKILYISGEESTSQIKNRAIRINNNQKSFDNIFLINETRLEIIIETIKKEKPSLVVVDSIQTTSSLDINSVSGSVTQVRYTADKLMEIAKTYKTAVVLIGHVTKDGDLAGPKTLEHIVDTVLNLEGDRYHSLRFIRCSKNRFGPVDEVGVFKMGEEGLTEVNNALQFIQNEKPKNSFGFTTSCALEGSRPFLIEIQALTNTTSFGYPKRTSSGIKLNRVQLLAAVISKHCPKIKLDNQDIYINITGGMSINDPSLDLGVIISIISSYMKKNISQNIGIIGEVGLSGEIREVPYLEKRLAEMKRAGITKVICPKIKDKYKTKIETLQINSITEAIDILM